ncbi:MAG: hypothetical protein HZC22_19595 [Rhodocyclales bacterium]|nr:hypothetical protein [Rhodocyclales bacterium]
MNRPATVCLAAIVFSALPGCSSQQMYESGKGYQRSQCERLPDMGERQRCLAKANMSYEEYRKETTRDQ